MARLHRRRRPAWARLAWDVARGGTACAWPFRCRISRVCGFWRLLGDLQLVLRIQRTGAVASGPCANRRGVLQHDRALRGFSRGRGLCGELSAGRGHDALFPSQSDGPGTMVRAYGAGRSFRRHRAGAFARHQYRLGFHSALVRQSVPLRGSLAARIWPLALVLWIPRLALMAGRLSRSGPAWWLRGLGMAPGLVLGSWIWTAGFVKRVLTETQSADRKIEDIQPTQEN